VSGFKSFLRRNWVLYAMISPAVALVFVFSYVPIYGLIIAFQDYQPVYGFNGSAFVGLKWFRSVLRMPDFGQIFFNTFIIAVAKILLNQIAAIFFALLLNELKGTVYKRVIQTFSYLPYFLSWVVIGGVFITLLSMDGAFNSILEFFGADRVFFLGSNSWFRPTVVITDVWKNYGWNSILYIAALSGINEELYEAAVIDGAGRWKQTLYITLPGISSTIVLLACLNLGGILNAGFEQLLVLYNPAVYQTGDILDTFVYRSGLVDAQFSLATAVGLIKSLLGFAMILISYKLAEKYAGYIIF